MLRNKIKYKHTINRIDPAKLFGIVVERHPKYKGIAFFFGHHNFDFWMGYRK